MKSLLKNHFLIGLIALLTFMITIKAWSQGGTKTFTVNVLGDESDPNAGNIGDDGICDVDPNTAGDQCTLRAAIENHNGNRNLGQNRIDFAIPDAPGSGSIVINVGATGLGPLPPVLGSVIIAALNSSGQGGDTRRIEIDGGMAGSNAIGLQLLGGQCKISFFIINSFSSHGIYIAGTPPPGEGGHLLESNRIGTDSTGTVDKGNGGDGIFIDNTPGNIIGGLGLSRNLISANKGYGIHILGRDISETGQFNGGTNNLAQANIIGLDLFQAKLLPNALDAVILENAPNNTIGGTGTNEGNVMGGAKNGVTIVGSFSEGIKIQGNFIGKDGTGAKFSAGIFARGGKQLSIEGNVLTNIDGVGVDLFLNAGGGYNILKNRFDGDMKIGSKFRFGPGQEVDIMYQNNFHTNNGLAFDVQESASGKINWIVLGDVIKGGQAGANVIFAAAGNKDFTSNRWEGSAGVGFTYAANIASGVNAKFTQKSEAFVGNGLEGVSGKITVGGELAVSMLDISGDQNGKDACRLEFVVGASASVQLSSARNKYTANGFFGLRMLSDGNNLDLMQAFLEADIMTGNILGGINILNMKLKHSVANCTITDNHGPGIVLDGSSDVRVDSNTISGNTTGILVNGAATGSISDNTITGNGTGIALAGTGTGVAISNNSIFNNTGLGIDLGNDGVTPNHAGFKPGPNNLQNHPVLTSADVSNGNIIIKGTMNSLANSIYRMEFFSNAACNPSGFGEGQNFLGSRLVATDASGNAAFTDTLSGVNLSTGPVITSTATDTLNNNSSEFSACLQAAVLPLHLIDFTAATNGNNIVLRWITAGEQNTKYFEIGRSEDGRTFSGQGQVPASGNSTEQKNYVFIDRHPPQGTNIYRLRMVDLDGSFTYSKIVTVKMDSLQNTLLVFPNPAATELTIQLFTSGALRLRIADANGRILKEELVQSSGNVSKTLDISSLPKGVYVLILQNSNEIQYRKFVKQ